MKTPPWRYPALLAAAYFYLEGIGCLIWWALLALSPAFRAWFVAEGSPEATLMALFAGDLTLFAGGAIAAGYALQREKPWAHLAVYLHAGAAAYAALYAVVLAAVYHGSLLGAALMAPSLIITPLIVWACAKGWL